MYAKTIKAKLDFEEFYSNVTAVVDETIKVLKRGDSKGPGSCVNELDHTTRKYCFFLILLVHYNTAKHKLS